MMNALVERATSEKLVGPDWSMNIGICDICNRDPRQAKDVVKGIKRRIGSKTTKVQLLALTLLETTVKNCGDYVHMNIAKKALLRDMVKIVKKKPDFQVKEKILVLIDTWQEAFGGARAKYPQYYAAYNELSHMGIIFPKSIERSPPVFTPLQTQPLKRNPENVNEVVESSAKDEFPTCLSLTEIQDARRIIGVLEEMLDSVDPQRKEDARQEVVVDLVMQCYTYKKRVGHLVKSTSDESLLRQGLSLNDDLQRVLDKHEALVSEASSTSNKLIIPSTKHEGLLASGISVTSEKVKHETCQALVPVDDPLIDKRERQTPGFTDTTDAEARVSTSNATNRSPSTPQKVNIMFDLLSGDDFCTSTSESSINITPLEKPQPTIPLSQHNAIAVMDMSSKNNTPKNLPAGQMYNSSHQSQKSQYFSYEQPSVNINGSLPSMVAHQSEPKSQYAHGYICPAGRTYSFSPKFDDSNHFPSQQLLLNPNGNLQKMVPPQYGSNPANGKCYLKQSQCLPSQQPSLNPFESVPNMLPLQYEQTYPYTQGSIPTADQTHSSSPQYFPSKRASLNQNGSLPNMVPLTSLYSQGSNTAWAGHIPRQQQQPFSPINGVQTRHGGLPPSPWEAQPADSNQSGGMQYPQPQRSLQTLGDYNNQTTTNVYAHHQITGAHVPSTMSHKATYPTNIPQQQMQITGVPPSPMTYNTIHLDQQFQGQPHMRYTYPQQMHSDPLAESYNYGGDYSYRSYGYTPLQNDHFFMDHRMQQLSVRENGFQASTLYPSPTSISNDETCVQIPFQNQSVPDDKLFQDLVDFTNIRPNKTTGKTETTEL